MNDSRLSVSWSRMTTYEACAQRVLRQMQGRSSPITDGRNFLPGTLADRAMRHWLEEADPQPGGMMKYVPGLFDEHTGPDAEYVIRWRGDVVADKRAVVMQVKECLENLEPFLLKHVVPYEYHPELRFTSTIQVPYLDGRPVPIDLRGGIDIAVRTSLTDYRLYDLKNTRNPDYVRGKTSGQLTFYHLAFAAYMGIDPECITSMGFVVPLTPERYVPVEISAANRAQMMTRIVNYAQGVWRKEWKPADSDSDCWNCDVRHACAKWAVPDVRDAQGRARASFAQAAAVRKASGASRTRRSAAALAAAEGEAGSSGSEEGLPVGEDP